MSIIYLDDGGHFAIIHAAAHFYSNLKYESEGNRRNLGRVK